MKTRSKALLLALCAVMLVIGTVMGTMAYLTDNDTVTNTFTVGKVKMTLDEADVKPDGTKEDTTERVKANEYHLLPGHEYIKDPTVHVEADSENAYIFVKIENGIADIEAVKGTTMKDGTTYNQIKDQIVAHGWKALKDAEGNDVAGVYYQEHTKVNAVKNYVVFNNFMIDGEKVVNAPAGNETLPEGKYNLDLYKTAKIVVTAYAVQMDGFENNPAGAWDVVKPASGN